MFVVHRLCAKALWALACLTLSAEASDLEARFKDPPPNATRPCVTLTLDAGRLDGDWILRQLERARDIGAGGVLLTVPTASETVWGTLARAADRARQYGLEIGFRDFYLSEEEASVTPRARKLVWCSTFATNQADFATNALPQVCRPGNTYQELARLTVPAGRDGVQPHQIVNLAQAPSPTGGLWRVYRFGLVDVDPPVRDGFEGAALFRHVNQWLFANQSRLKQTYGNTLMWCQFSGPSSCELVWQRDMPAVFLKRSGLDLERHLPALAGVAVGGDATALYVRQQVALAVREAWRDRFGRNVNELVHEAGLEAGIRIDEVPIAPEEVSLYFRRPTLPQARHEAQREANVRAAGGARTMGRRYVIGLLDVTSVVPPPDARLLPFPWRHEVDRLLSEGATRLLFDAGGSIPGEDVVFRQMRDGCQYAHRCQVMLQQGAAVADFLVWAQRLPPVLRPYACDFADGAMLDAADVRDGQIRFDSERFYGVLAVTSAALRDKRAERMVCQMASRGVRVWLVATGETDEEATFARVLDKAGANVGVLRAEGTAGMPPPDFLWRSDVAGLRLEFLHRRSAEHEVYFVVNTSSAAGPVTCTFRDTGKGVPTRWNPVNGETGLVVQDVQRTPDGRVSAALFLAPHDACFVVFDH